MGSWIPTVSALALVLAPLAQAGVVQWDIERRQFQHGIHRRSANSTFEEVIMNEKRRGGYFATVTVGTPGQDLVMQLDTASSDIWVPYSGASICDDGMCALGSYNPQKSSSFGEVAKGQFDILYADKSKCSGDYIEDTFEIGGAVVHNMTMGLGTSTDIPHGLVGVGYVENEASLDTLGDMYPNLPIAMQQDGLTNTVAYSLWLNDLDASKGNILFGGVDREKYVGTLKKVEVLPYGSSYTHFRISMSSLEATSPTGTDVLVSSEGPIEVILDSGTTLSYLPDDVAKNLWREVGAIYHADFEMAILPCSHMAHPGYFCFGFGGPGGPQINITMDELVVDLTNGQQPVFSSGPYEGELVCEFGVQNYSSEPYILGDTFLRSAYVVYDLENNEIALAATDFNSTRSNIVEFKNKGDPIPLATSVSSETYDASSSPAPTSTHLTAAEGFQDGDGTDSSVDAVRPMRNSWVWACLLSIVIFLI